MTPVDRRTFVKGIAAASAAAAAGPALAAGELLHASDGGDGSVRTAPRWQKAPCRMCGVGCGLLVAIENGRATAVKGDPDSPVSRGLACAKGYHSVQALYGRDRLTRARVRRGDAMVEVPINQALDIVAQRLRETVARHGRDSVAVYGSAEWTLADAYVATKLFRGGIGTSNVDSSARLHSAAATAALESTFGMGGSIGCYEDIDHADVFVLWDANVAESDPVLFSRMLERRRKNPAVRIIDVTTRTTRTSYAADNSLLHAPHTMLAVANAICHEIVARKWVNREFIERHVAFRRARTPAAPVPDDTLVQETAVDASFEDFAAFLGNSTPQRAQQISGVPADRIRWLASLYADKSRKVMSVWGANASRHTRGLWTNNALYNIHLLVGKIATPGNAALCTVGEPGAGTALSATGALAHTLSGGVAPREEDHRRAAAVWGVPAERIGKGPARTALAMFRALERGDVRFLWIQSSNPMAALPNLARYRRAAAGDRFVVVSDAYPTATTDIADVILPSAMWLERDGVFVSSERRVQHFEQMVPPPGEAMSDAWQMIEVGRRIGMSSLLPYDRAGHAERIYAEYRRFHGHDSTAAPPMPELREQRGAIWPFARGRETRWRYNTAHDPAADRARGAFHFYGFADGRARIWLRPYAPPVEAPDGEYPFWLSTGPVLEHWNSGTLTRRVPTLHRAAPHAYLEMHKDDAKRLGIGNREMVRVVSRRGSLEVEARVEHRSQPARGHFFIPSFDESLPVAKLMPDSTCSVSGQPQLTACAVRIERIRPRGGA